MQRAAFITGVTGQDGSYLAELLLAKGYRVHGLVRRSSSFNTERVEHLTDRAALTLHFGDVMDMHSVQRVLAEVKAENPGLVEVYNLAAQSHVKVSFDMPVYTAQADGVGVLNVLEAVRLAGFDCPVRVCQASTSEMFGASPPPQSEATPFHPRSPYGAAKLFGYWAVRNYREAYGLFACNCIAFNHESERRGKTFVTRKITRAVARIVDHGLDDAAVLELGNLDALRDWGHAEDYVRAMWLMLQQDAPDDYVVATGEQHSVREFVELAFAAAGVPVAWKGQGVAEVGVDPAGRVVVRVNPRYFRPTEVDSLLGDAAKLRARTGWAPRVPFPQLVRRMVAHDMDPRNAAAS